MVGANVCRKQVLDDDDRELMRYKEMYLPDGDLHSEGEGRQRRFHWKNMGMGMKNMGMGMKNMCMTVNCLM